MRTVRPVPILLACLVASVIALPGAAAQGPTSYAEGHIDAAVMGVPLAYYALFGFTGFLIGGPDDGLVAVPWAFQAPVQIPAGTLVTTEVTDNSGTGYFVEFAFLDADGAEIETSCGAGENDGLLVDNLGQMHITDVCIAPPGAASVYVYAHHGIDLDVRLVDAPLA